LVAELRAGAAFGELALIYGAPRAATVKAAEPTDLLVINKAAFDKVVKQQYVDKIDERIEFFKHFPVFPNLDKAVLLNLATIAVYLKYQPGDTVIAQNAVPFYVYFVKAGELKAVRELTFRKIDPPENLEGEALIKELVKDPEKPEIDKNLIYKKSAEIDTFGIFYFITEKIATGSSFADYEVLNVKPMQCSVIAAIPSEVLAVSKFEILNLDADTKKTFKDFAKPYPADSVLRRAFIETDNWIKYKQQLLTNIQGLKETRKKFSDMLRSEKPLPQTKKDHKYVPLGSPKRKMSPAKLHKLMGSSPKNLK